MPYAIILNRQPGRINYFSQWSKKSSSLSQYEHFRDYLNEHPAVAKEYETLKLRLRKQYEHNRDAYTDAKTDFSPNGQQKRERNMETDTDTSSLWEQGLSYVAGEMMEYEMTDLPRIAIIGKEGLCTKEKNAVQALWQQANSDFGETADL